MFKALVVYILMLHTCNLCWYNELQICAILTECL